MTRLQRALLSGLLIANGCWAAAVAVAFVVSMAAQPEPEDPSSILGDVLLGLVSVAVVASPSYGVWRLRRSLAPHPACAASPSGWRYVKAVYTWPGISAALLAVFGLALLYDASRAEYAAADLWQRSMELWFAAMACLLVVWPLSMVGRVQFRLTDGGVVFPPRITGGASWIPWERLASVTQERIDMRGLVFAHEWSFRATDGTAFTVVYPAGALPWPGTMIREIRRRAPHVRGV